MIGGYVAKLSWDQIGERIYENGLSRGVFYDKDSSGIPWNGLTSVQEASVDSAEPLHYDGLKYGDLITLGDFKGVLKAFTYPMEFLEYEGVQEAEPGFSLTGQPKSRFSLSWRTEINSDLGQTVGYKIHILYNVLAIPAQKTFETLALENEPIEFEWDITAIPSRVDNYRPTAYIVLDSTRMDPLLLQDIENFLYGTDDQESMLPNLNALVTFTQNWARFVIIDNGDGTWTASTVLPDVITMLDAESFQITVDTAEYIDPPDNTTYEISSDELEAP